ncbi:Solute carrier family 39 (Metal ion transporter), member 11 [Seminavis robusta]|uniref:Solute carrier family 39 (Metal ion transporter), member 11 n=1 Tax=Seminavis robusta TaxID=568900 RepID=A0A9N8E8F3_9STRA|nr:Solute carrier family 39 (Metal ion transporter), member 11 [Seminavis robusta]|eukprot:Sro785_g202100.1 Solute carrier family 39 (Metal ion transporter), member 11 (217) ;mRNA; f:14744-15394
MMVAASISLVWEGVTFTEPHDYSELSTHTRTAIGAGLGVCFILGTKGILDKYEDLKVGGMDGTDARKALLVFFVMTLHSFSEGVGIGVSFGGTHGSDLGVFISASLAVHNVPEGLAIAVVLLPKGTSTLTAALWAVATSIPQPLMAVPAYLFVHHFIPIVPIGLGFAGGAMAWVAVFELLAEAIEDTDIVTTGSVASLSLATMMYIVEKIEASAKV